MLAFAAPAAAEAPTAEQRLKAVVQAYRQADFEGCLRQVSGLARAKLKNPDVVVFLQGQCLFYAGQPDAARRAFERLGREHPASPHAPLALARQGDCLWAMGRKAQAVERYARAQKGRRSARVDPAIGLARRAEWAYATGRSKEGRRRWLELLLKHPRHPLAVLGPPDRPELQLTVKESLALGQALNQARAWEAALAVVDSAPEPGNDRQRFELAMLAGRILFDMRFHYDQAAELLFAARDRAPRAEQAEEAWFYGSRALGRADEDDQAIASHLAMVAKYPKGKNAGRALFYAGWLEQNQGRCDRALPIFARVRREYPKQRWAREAGWFEAWCLIQKKDWRAAIGALKPQLAWRGFRFGGRARYWTGVAEQALDHHGLARRSFRKVIATYPLTWYARLAAIRLGDEAPALAAPPAATAAPSLDDPSLGRADELVRAGAPELAALLLRQDEKAFLGRHPGRTGRIALMEAFRRAGDFNRPWYLSLVKERRALERLPTAETRRIWDHAYPPCARDLLERQVGDDQHLVLMLQGIMRTESGFDPSALSVANARGLMQMIPPTAVRVAAELGMADYTDDALFEPETNIRTAVWYIGRLVQKFKRQWPLAAAAYNGGPQPMMEWCRENGALDLDAFVETIPYTESRRYAKRVYTAMWRYTWLEGAPPPALSLEVDPAYLEIEPNF